MFGNNYVKVNSISHNDYNSYNVTRQDVYAKNNAEINPTSRIITCNSSILIRKHEITESNVQYIRVRDIVLKMFAQETDDNTSFLC